MAAVKKKVSAKIKVQVKAQEANPSPPVGTALGPHGVNIMDFCKAFNERTKNLEKGIPIPVEITVYADRTIAFITKTPPAKVLILKELGIPKGSPTPNKEKVGKISRVQLEKIAQTKMQDLNAFDMDAAIRIIAGTAKSMGIEVEG